jgi:ABC-2 type transport system ATP-binding protein
VSTSDLTQSISLTGIGLKRGSHPVFDGLDAQFPSACVTGLVGANGQGKSTLFLMLLGVLKPHTGRGTVLGRELHRPHEYLNRVAGVVDGPAFYPSKSVGDNLRIVAETAGIRQPSAIINALTLVGLDQHARTPSGRLSLGMRQRLSLATVLVRRPKVILLDEPTNGLDPAAVAGLGHILRQLAESGCCVVVTSHDLHLLDKACSRYVVIDNGHTIYEGAPEEESVTYDRCIVSFADASERERAMAALDEDGIQPELRTTGAYPLLHLSAGDIDSALDVLFRAGVRVHEIRRGLEGTDLLQARLTGWIGTSLTEGLGRVS